MRGTMRSPISTTLNFTPRAASASMMMQPMKPAPSCNTRVPLPALAMMWRASAKVQQVCTPSELIPGIGGAIGCEPLAISKVSKLASIVVDLSVENAMVLLATLTDFTLA